MGASLLKLQRVDVGFAADGVVTQQLVLPQSRYDRAAQTRFYDALTTRLMDDPRVSAAGGRLPLAVRQQPGVGDHPARSPGAGRRAGSRIHGPPRLDHAAVLRRDGHPAPGRPDLHHHRPARRGHQRDRQPHLRRPAVRRRRRPRPPAAARRRTPTTGTSWSASPPTPASAKVDAAAEPIVYLPHTHLTLPFMRLLVRGTGAEPPRPRRCSRRCGPRTPSWRSIRRTRSRALVVGLDRRTAVPQLAGRRLRGRRRSAWRCSASTAWSATPCRAARARSPRASRSAPRRRRCAPRCCAKAWR